MERGAGVLLYHAGTGEVSPIELQDEEQVSVRVLETGAAEVVVSRIADGLELRTQSHADFLKKIYCRSATEHDEIERFFVVDGEESAWCKDLRAKYDVRAVSVRQDGAILATMQVYLFGLGLPPTFGRVWWSLQHAAEYVISGTKLPVTYVKDRMITFLGELSDAGFASENLRRSRHSQLQAGKRKAGAATPAVIEPALQYHTLTTRGLIAVLLYWTNHRARQGGLTINGQCAGRLLEMIVHMAAQHDGFVVSCLVTGADIIAIDSQGAVEFESLRTHAVNALRVAATKLAGVVEDGRLRFADVIKYVWQTMKTPSRCGQRLQSLMTFFQSAVDAIHMQLEVSLGEPMWTQSSLLDLKPSKRSVGLARTSYSRAFKASVQQAARDCTTRRQPSAILDGLSMSSGIAPAEVPNHAQTAYRALREETLAYVSDAKVEFAQSARVHLTLDGVAAGDDENLILVYHHLRGSNSAIAPIKVPAGRLSRHDVSPNV